MPQEFQVVQCYECHTFQVDIIKKLPKWCCKICGAKQSVVKVYNRGTGKTCRLHVQELNEKRIILESGMCERVISEHFASGLTNKEEAAHESFSGDQNQELYINKEDNLLKLIRISQFKRQQTYEQLLEPGFQKHESPKRNVVRDKENIEEPESVKLCEMSEVPKLVSRSRSKWNQFIIENDLNNRDKMEFTLCNEYFSKEEVNDKRLHPLRRLECETDGNNADSKKVKLSNIKKERKCVSEIRYLGNIFESDDNSNTECLLDL